MDALARKIEAEKANKALVAGGEGSDAGYPAGSAIAGELPFVGEDACGEPIFCKVARTGDWIADGEVGEAYARIFLERLERIRVGQRPPLLAWIVKDMVRAGPANWSGLEVGFLQYLERTFAHMIARERLMGACIAPRD
jgi:hypothetical protein